MHRVWVSLGIIGVALTTMSMKASAEQAAGPEFYTAKVKPILETGCYKCHGGKAHRGGLSMVTRAGMLKGGHTGPAIIPGDPEKSLLVTLIKHEGQGDDPMPMPPKPRAKLSDEDIATISRWIKAGAMMP